MAERPMSLQLASMDDLVQELASRNQHTVIGFRTIPVNGVNQVVEGFYVYGDFRMCQGLAQGLITHVDGMIVASRTRREEKMIEAPDEGEEE